MDVSHHSSAPPLSSRRSSLAASIDAPTLWNVTSGWSLEGWGTVGSPANPRHCHFSASFTSKLGSSLIPKLKKVQGLGGFGPHNACPVANSTNSQVPCLIFSPRLPNNLPYLVMYAPTFSIASSCSTLFISSHNCQSACKECRSGSRDNIWDFSNLDEDCSSEDTSLDDGFSFVTADTSYLDPSGAVWKITTDRNTKTRRINGT
mmetsp:Transcript_38976/g.46923  ORF Transcript_38976/g.46923 Transcript_38976/m.46923 type:complete len:204 (+) Transcript_38976:278-889(+)